MTVPVPFKMHVWVNDKKLNFVLSKTNHKGESKNHADFICSSAKLWW